MSRLSLVSLFCSVALGSSVAARVEVASAVDLLPSGSEFSVNTYTTGLQAPSVGRSVAAGPGGSFVVAWTEERAVTGYDIFTRRFAADGDPDSDEVFANAFLRPAGSSRHR